jgi:hypothetical protein
MQLLFLSPHEREYVHVLADRAVLKASYTSSLRPHTLVAQGLIH